MTWLRKLLNRIVPASFHVKPVPFMAPMDPLYWKATMTYRVIRNIGQPNEYAEPERPCEATVE